jgi:uncharacterized membrane protein
LVWPADAADEVSRRLDRLHFTGPNRTLAQDLSFAIDQLVEIAIRALSPAVNDTFSAMTCIDWLSDGVRYERFVERAFDKIRQPASGNPAVMIRQLDALGRIMEYTTTAEQRAALFDQADMIMRNCEHTVPEEEDRADVARRYDTLVAVAARVRKDVRSGIAQPVTSSTGTSD